MTVLEKGDDGWYYGYTSKNPEKEGNFPSNLVLLLIGPASDSPQRQIAAYNAAKTLERSRTRSDERTALPTFAVTPLTDYIKAHVNKQYLKKELSYSNSPISQPLTADLPDSDAEAAIALNRSLLVWTVILIMFMYRCTWGVLNVKTTSMTPCV